MVALLAAAILVLPEKVLGDVTVRLDSGRWRVVRYSTPHENGDEPRSVRIFHDGKRVLTKTGEYLYDAVFIEWPYSGRLLAVSEHSWAGHGMDTHFYRADREGLNDLRLDLPDEVNGPVFRDLDGDGRKEVVFDNNDWYVFYGKLPTKLRAFKYDGKRLRLWREFPNRKKERLPFRLPLF